MHKLATSIIGAGLIALGTSHGHGAHAAKPQAEHVHMGHYRSTFKTPRLAVGKVRTSSGTHNRRRF